MILQIINYILDQSSFQAPVSAGTAVIQGNGCHLDNIVVESHGDFYGCSVIDWLSIKKNAQIYQ